MSGAGGRGGWGAEERLAIRCNRRGKLQAPTGETQEFGVRRAWVPLAATFCGGPGFEGVKTFFKVVLILIAAVIAAVIAVKLLPLTLALGFGLGLAVVALALAGVGIIAALAVVAIFLAALLSPIWVPVLLLVGLIALIKRASRGRRPVALA